MCVKKVTKHYRYNNIIGLNYNYVNTDNKQYGLQINFALAT